MAQSDLSGPLQSERELPPLSPGRRRFITLALSAIGAGITAILGVPLAGLFALPALASPPPQFAEGRKLFETQGCSACHVVKGAGGLAGPDLTRIGSRRNAQWIKRFIQNPSAVNPGSSMPPFKNLSEQELSALASYLASLR